LKINPLNAKKVNFLKVIFVRHLRKAWNQGFNFFTLLPDPELQNIKQEQLSFVNANLGCRIGWAFQ